MSDLDGDTLVDLGEYCAAFLDDHRFPKLWETFALQNAHALLSTKPHEQKTRESIYASFSGTHSFIGFMQALQAGKDKLTQAEPPLDPELIDLPDVNSGGLMDEPTADDHHQ